MDKQEYEELLKKDYQRHVDAGHMFFQGQLSEAAETDSKGVPLSLTGEQLEDNEDDLI